jgi:hypothetical protein
MRLNLVKSGLVAALLIGLFSCGKTKNYTTCNLNYVAPLALDSSRQVIYEAVTSGNGGSIKSLSYLDSNGTTTVNNPSLPFSAKVNLKKGTYITMGLSGTANYGGNLYMSVITDTLTVISCGD